MDGADAYSGRLARVDIARYDGLQGQHDAAGSDHRVRHHGACLCCLAQVGDGPTMRYRPTGGSGCGVNNNLACAYAKRGVSSRDRLRALLDGDG